MLRKKKIPLSYRLKTIRKKLQAIKNLHKEINKEAILKEDKVEVKIDPEHLTITFMDREPMSASGRIKYYSTETISDREAWNLYQIFQKLFD